MGVMWVMGVGSQPRVNLRVKGCSMWNGAFTATKTRMQGDVNTRVKSMGELVTRSVLGYFASNPLKFNGRSPKNVSHLLPEAGRISPQETAFRQVAISPLIATLQFADCYSLHTGFLVPLISSTYAKCFLRYVRFEVFTAVTMKNAVFWAVRTQFQPHRRHITSLLQSPAG
jgi:hypothetical protein